MSSVFKQNVLDGKVALITGGGTGICKGITRSLMEHGCNVSITSRKLENLITTAKELESQTNKSCFPLAADVRNPDQIKEAVKKTVERFGKLDILVCGAAGNFLAMAESLSSNAFKTVTDIDLNGTFNTVSAAFPYLKETKGSIINISATLHYTGTPLQVHAAAAKAGIDSMTKTLAVEWGRYGIRVNAIAPGPIADTEGFRKLTPPQVKKGNMDQSSLASIVPLQRFGKIHDIEQMALYLCTDAARFFKQKKVL